MRTVTFSSDAVQKTLNDQFVCALVNTKGDPSAGMSMSHAPKDQPGPCIKGIGHQNVQCLFLTPKGEILHAASGYLDPEDLQQELDFALKTFADLKKTSPAKAKELVSEVHLKRARELGFTDAQIQQPQGFGGFDAIALFGTPNFQTPPANRSTQSSKQPNGQASGRRQAGNNFNGFPGFSDFANNFPFGPNGFDMNSMFEFKTKETQLRDLKFSINHPLLAWSQFVKQPQLLVGHEKTAFGSTGTGGASGGRIGK